MWCRRRNEKIRYTDHVKNEEVLHRVEKDRNISYYIKLANWIGHVFCKNCLLKHVTEGKIKLIGRRRRRRKQLVDNIKNKKKMRVIESGFRRGWGHGLRQTAR
jgi:hypothetical protein